MSRPTKIGIVVAATAFVAFLVYSALSLGEVKVEVCMEFNGRTECRTAAAPTQEEATRTAVDNACGLLASGRDQNIACSNRPPKSVRRLSP